MPLSLLTLLLLFATHPNSAFHASYKIERCKRHQVLAARRREQHHQKLEQDRRNAEAIRQNRKSELENLFEVPATHNFVQGEIVTDAAMAIDEKLSKFLPHKEMKDAGALEASIGFYEKLEWLLNAAKMRFNDDTSSRSSGTAKAWRSIQPKAQSSTVNAKKSRPSLKTFRREKRLSPRSRISRMNPQRHSFQNQKQNDYATQN